MKLKIRQTTAMIFSVLVLLAIIAIPGASKVYSQSAATPTIPPTPTVPPPILSTGEGCAPGALRNLPGSPQP